uniref:Putative ovule protein n=1 Tax=Solanum chacoense TaxID=4108 RepID=A0A0V0GVY6_SOLCH
MLFGRFKNVNGCTLDPPKVYCCLPYKKKRIKTAYLLRNYKVSSAFWLVKVTRFLTLDCFFWTWF